MAGYQFQPSAHSYGVIESPHYDGWLANLWSKEGRAKNKSKRAKRRRKMDWEAGARRSEQRAAKLRVKASGKKMLTPDSKASSLWAVYYPWGRRKRMTTSGLLGTARGYRPPQMYMDSEWKATVVGGILALKAGGIKPWVKFPDKRLEVKMRGSPSQDRSLIKAVERSSGKKFADMRKTSGYIRKIVIENKLGSAAWAARKLSMLGAVSLRQAAAGAGAGVASTALYAASGGPQAIVTVPLALIGNAISAVSSAKGKKAKAEAELSQQQFTQAMQNWGGKLTQAASTRETDRMASAARYQEQIAREVGEVKGQQAAEYAKILGVAGGVTVSLVAVSFLVRKMRESK